MKVQAERAQGNALTAREAVRSSLTNAHVAVLMGGASGEREVSLRTGDAVLRALRSQSQDDGRGPARVSGVEIEASGAWRRDGVLASASRALVDFPRETVFFLAMHGGAGEDGTLQGFLVADGRVHTGSGVRASALCMNKHATRLVLREAGLCIAPGACFDAGDWRERRRGLLAELNVFGRAGWVVKPNHGGSSVATSMVSTTEELPAAIDAALSSGDRALVEARIRGVEVTCAVLGNSGDELRALPLVEIIPHEGRFFDYEEKYSAAGADEVCPPSHVSAAACRRVQELAVRAHRAAGCDGYSRIDFIVPRDAEGREGEPVVLEINTLPGLTERSLLPRAALSVRMDMRDLCLEILGLALRRDPRRPAVEHG